MEDLVDIVQQAEEAIARLGVRGVVSAEHVAESILKQVAYWEVPEANGEKLLFLRLFSPVIQREEVFLGNVLLNDFLCKTFIRSVADSRYGNAELVANDLRNYYFLVHTNTNMGQLVELFRDEIKHSLPDLFFGRHDEARGLYGSIETMLAFEKANVEPFPVFIMPRSFMVQLEKTVRRSILRKIKNNPMNRNPTSIMANLSFFYSRDGAEMQSPYLFLARLLLQYNVVDMNDFRLTFKLNDDIELGDESGVKSDIEDSLKGRKGRTFCPTLLRGMLEQVIIELGSKAELDPANYLMPYIRSKFLDYDEGVLIDRLLDSISLGSRILGVQPKRVINGCRVCGAKVAELGDKSILMGQNTHRFHNQSSKHKNEKDSKVCLRCAICTYLMVKLIGSEAVGQPQVPKNYNLIFHYGKHTNEEIKLLVHRIDLIWNLLRQHRDIEYILREIAEQVRELQAKQERGGDGVKKEAPVRDLAKKNVERKETQFKLEEIKSKILSVCPWLRDSGRSLVPVENPSLDMLVNTQLSESKVERHILGLGMGGYRMVVFVLPQIRAPRGAKEHDFAQRRFSHSRVTVIALLSFLRKLCGCDGPFYYQSLPTLSGDAFRRDIFYVHNQPISVREVQTEYEVVTQLAWKLIRQTGSKGFVRKLMLAERLLRDPLGTFSSVMRNSSILGQSKGTYKTLEKNYREDWKARDLTQYAYFIQRLLRLQEVK